MLWGAPISVPCPKPKFVEAVSACRDNTPMFARNFLLRLLPSSEPGDYN